GTCSAVVIGPPPQLGNRVDHWCLLRWKRDENHRVQPALLDSMGTGVQAVEPSPCRPGLAWRFAGWFRFSHALRACDFPLGLSSSGTPVDPGVIAGLPLSSEMRI